MKCLDLVNHDEGHEVFEGFATGLHLNVNQAQGHDVYQFHELDFQKSPVPAAVPHLN